MIKKYKKVITVEVVKLTKRNKNDIIKLLSSSNKGWRELVNGFLIFTTSGVIPVTYSNDQYLVKENENYYLCNEKELKENFEDEIHKDKR